MLRKILQAERDQVADYARVNDAITSAETEIAALKKRNFGPDEMRIAIVTIRDRAILTIRDVRKNMARRADEALPVLRSCRLVRVRLDRKATSISLLVVIGVRADGQK